MKKFFSVVSVFLCLSGCAGTSGSYDVDDANDPLELPNRMVFSVNMMADTVVLKPLAEMYHGLAPEPVRTGIYSGFKNFFSNIMRPVNALLNLARGEVAAAREDIMSFTVNTSVGFLGIADFATDFGIERKDTDLGEVLAHYGVGEGPYIVLPVLGGYNLRDTAGPVLEYYADPAYLFVDSDERSFLIGTSVVNAIITREKYLGILDVMEKDSLDFYVTAREYYRQNRRSKIKGADPSGPASYDFDMDSYDDEDDE